jgi:hypothetical protein
MKILLNHSKAKKLYQDYPDHIGVLFSPIRTRFYAGIPFAIDNGAYSAFLNKTEWDEVLFWETIRQFQDKKPSFIVCPDIVANKKATLDLWEKYSATIRAIAPVAFVFTDGMDILDIPNDADFVFIGGTTAFKEFAITLIPKIKQPTHVGRVNYHGRLWKSFNYGAVSCDGTGWFRGDPRQEQHLIDYLDIQSGRRNKESNCLFFVGSYCL